MFSTFKKMLTNFSDHRQEQQPGEVTEAHSGRHQCCGFQGTTVDSTNPGIPSPHSDLRPHCEKKLIIASQYQDQELSGNGVELPCLY